MLTCGALKVSTMAATVSAGAELPIAETAKPSSRAKMLYFWRVIQIPSGVS
jgi:hypothetical protein